MKLSLYGRPFTQKFTVLTRWTIYTEVYCPYTVDHLHRSLLSLHGGPFTPKFTVLIRWTIYTEVYKVLAGSHNLQNYRTLLSTTEPE